MTFACKFTDDDITAILDEYQSGADRAALCARHGISVRTLFRWQARRGRNRPALLDMMSALQGENARLRQMLNRVGPEVSLKNQGRTIDRPR